MQPTLVFITDVDVFGVKLTLEAVERLSSTAAPGTVAVQVRDRQLPVRSRLTLCRELREITRRFGQYLVVNQSLDLAVLAQADGLHLGEGAVPLAELSLQTAQFPCLAWISRAWHPSASLPELGAQAYLVSPVVAARKGTVALGLQALSAAAARVPGAAVYALGGVDSNSAAACVAAGAAGVAVIGAGYREPSELLSSLGIVRRRSD